jgi:hypothetical protein
MVLRRMGLLDDAIREHLELKRRRGADPGEVAREQREALDTIDDQAPARGAGTAQEASGPPAVSGAPLIDRPADAQPEPTTVGDVPPSTGPADPVRAAGPPEPAGGAGAGETAELDMSSVLGEDTEHAPTQDATSAPTADAGESLEWEMPADTAAREAAAEEPDEDVLEETPDFLRDTPEQDRLWFEQRPPRDFDFDK